MIIRLVCHIHIDRYDIRNLETDSCVKLHEHTRRAASCGAAAAAQSSSRARPVNAECLQGSAEADTATTRESRLRLPQPVQGEARQPGRGDELKLGVETGRFPREAKRVIGIA